MDKVRVISISLVALFFFLGLIFAQDDVTLQDKMISSTIKTLTKAFIAITDCHKIVDKLNTIDEEVFKKRYAQLYEFFAYLPSDIKIKYGISDRMTKEQMISRMISLDKNELYKSIDALPDEVLATQFRLYLKETKQNLENKNLLEQVDVVWSKFTKIVQPSVSSPNTAQPKYR